MRAQESATISIDARRKTHAQARVFGVDVAATPLRRRKVKRPLQSRAASGALCRAIRRRGGETTEHVSSQSTIDTSSAASRAGLPMTW